MKLRLFNLMRVLLILLCVGSSVEWVRSYWISAIPWACTDRNTRFN